MKGLRRLFAITLITGVACLAVLLLWHKCLASFATGLPAGGSALRQDLQALAVLNPIDTHTHDFKSDPAFTDMLRQLHLQVRHMCG